MVHPLQIELVFQLNSGVHITGELAKLWTDKALVVDWRDGSKPVVPATTLKGWLRERAERILRGLGQTIVMARGRIVSATSSSAWFARFSALLDSVRGCISRLQFWTIRPPRCA